MQDYKVPIHIAKAKLSALLRRVQAGQRVIIAHRDQPVAELVAYKHETKREFGALKGKASIDQSFFEALSEDELEAWE